MTLAVRRDDFEEKRACRRVLMRYMASVSYGKIIHQDFLDMAVAPCVGIFHPDQLQMVGIADFLLFPVAVPDGLIVKMLLAVQFDGQHGKLGASLPFIDNEIKAP